MAVDLPPLAPGELAAALVPLSPEPLAPAVIARLEAHYEELRRWSRTLSLVGPGTAGEVALRHFGEALVALPFLPPERGGRLVDLGSGAGFPGLVLAAARPTWQVTLVEARERKWAFLQAVTRRAALSAQCLNARVGPLLPPGMPAGYEVVTMRALRLPPDSLAAVAARLVPEGKILIWAGDEDPALPPGLRVARVEPLPGARARRLLLLEHASAGTRAPDGA